jgi:hypothetical protein
MCYLGGGGMEGEVFNHIFWDCGVDAVEFAGGHGVPVMPGPKAVAP